MANQRSGHAPIGSRAEVLGQGGRQEEPGVGHQAIVVEGRIRAVAAVR